MEDESPTLNVNYSDTTQSFACLIMLRRYDLRKHVNTFKARCQTSENKINIIQHVECALSYSIAIDMANCLFQ